MAKNNKLPPKNAAAKAVSVKAHPSKTVAKSAKASTVPKSVTPKKAAARPASASKSAPPKTSAAKSPAKPAVASAKTASKAPAKAAAPAAKQAPVKAAAVKAPVKPAAAVATVASAVAAPHAQQRAMPASGAKLAAATISTPVQVARAAPPAAPQLKAAAPAASLAIDPNAPKKTITSRHGFKTSELIVYPAHGVGRIIGIEEQEIAGISLELFVIEFEKDKMTLRVPTSKLVSVGMRKLAEDGVLKKAMETLKGKARIKRTMWSRRAQEYEAKINSGDLVAIAEVVRDLYRSEAQPEQSYSERQLYEAALDRMSRELAAVDKSDERSAMQRITEILAKSAKGRRAVEDAQSSSAEEGDVQAA